METQIPDPALKPESLTTQTEEKTKPLPLPARELVRYTRVQMLVGHLLLLPFCGLIAGLMRFVGGYRIENMKELRRQYRLIAKTNSPLMICSNHLTFIDSTLLIWALASNFWYQFNYRAFSWNLPAGDVFKKKIYFRLVAYLGKCIFIHRDGSKEHKEEILGLSKKLLREGHVITIFPEGRRSRLGMFDTDHITFGAGKIIASLGTCQVLCVYIRGDKQQGYSNYPPRGSRFNIQTELVTIGDLPAGRAGYLAASQKISVTIKGLENKYFGQRGNLWN